MFCWSHQPRLFQKGKEHSPRFPSITYPAQAPQVPVGQFRIINFDQWWTTKDRVCKSVCACQWAKVEIWRSRYGREWFGPEAIDRTSNLARISPLEQSPLPRMAGGVSGDRLLRLTPDLDPKEMRDGISVTGFGGQGERQRWLRHGSYRVAGDPHDVLGEEDADQQS